MDIVDSIKGTEISPWEFKAELYQVLRKDYVKTINHFKRYKYPNIKEEQKEDFLDGIINMMDERNTELASKNLINPLLMLLKTLVEKAKSQKELPFIQEEETNVWVKPFIQFYRQEILLFHKKELKFDEERQVQKELEIDTMEIDGKLLTNYSFIDSKADAMVQVSDYVVSIIRKYIMFLDRTEPEVETDIKSFDKIQMRNFNLLNSILKYSSDYNPLYLHLVICLHTYKKFMKYLNEYGNTH